MGSSEIDRTPVKTFFNRVYNETVKGSAPSNMLILAQRDVFEALSRELEGIYRFGAQQIIQAPRFRFNFFKNATVYKLDQPGWSIKLLNATTLEEATMSDRIFDATTAPLTAGGCSQEPAGKIPYPSALFVRKDDALDMKARIDDLNARMDASKGAEQGQCGTTSGGAAGSAGLAAQLGTRDYDVNRVPGSYPAPPLSDYSDSHAAILLKAGLRGCLLEMQQQRAKLSHLLDEQNRKIGNLRSLLRDLGELA